MFQFFKLNAEKIAIFVLSVFFGGVAYLVVDLLGTPGPVAEPAIVSFGDLEISNTKFDGEFKLFAVAEDPVDLGFSRDANVFFLTKSGSIVKSVFDEHNQRQLTSYFDIEWKDFHRQRGCSAMAFHPDFAVKDTDGYGKFYVAVAERKGTGLAFEEVESEPHQEVIYEFTTRDHSGGRFEGSRREVFRLSGLPDVKGSVITDLTFDHRGFLYLGICDSSETVNSKASDLMSVYGKVLRIDPLRDEERNMPYRIPGSNPFFLVHSCLSELWSSGLRNPHSITYDPLREWVCISDTGKDMLEEFNVSHFGAEFFGWNLSEGSFFYPPNTMHKVGEEISSPRIEYPRGGPVGRNVGGLIYRGERFPYLDGKAIFADESGRLLSAEVGDDQPVSKLNVLKAFDSFDDTVKSLKSGPEGELFVICESGKIFELDKSRPLLRHVHIQRSMLATVSW